MVEIVETLEQKLKRHEDALVACMAEIERLRAENAGLRSAAGALDTLQNIYRDESVPRSERIKAAIASLQHEVPRLLPEKAAIDVTAHQSKPLSQVVEEQRRRCDQILNLSLEQRERLIRGVARDGNGGSDSQGNSHA